MSEHKGWIGVDFDGTLAEYGTWQGADHCGAPVPLMVERVKEWLSEGYEVRIFTARIYPLWWAPVGLSLPALPVLPGVATPAYRLKEAATAVAAIRAWCRDHIGQELCITNVKDYGMMELWDDRAVQVTVNTGVPVGKSTRGL